MTSRLGKGKQRNLFLRCNYLLPILPPSHPTPFPSSPLSILPLPILPSPLLQCPFVPLSTTPPACCGRRYSCPLVPIPSLSLSVSYPHSPLSFLNFPSFPLSPPLSLCPSSYPSSHPISSADAFLLNPFLFSPSPLSSPFLPPICCSFPLAFLFLPSPSPSILPHSSLYRPPPLPPSHPPLSFPSPLTFPSLPSLVPLLSYTSVPLKSFYPFPHPPTTSPRSPCPFVLHHVS